MYHAPVDETLFTLRHIIGVEKAIAHGDFGDLSMDLIEAILLEAGKFAEEEWAPLNRSGDIEHAQHIENGSVKMPTGFATAYRHWCEAGWNGLSAPEAFGGQALPSIIASAVNEYWSAANMSLHLCPLLTAGAIETIFSHGTEELKTLYLPNLISGIWTGTMNLTEPQAGSDLNAITTQAKPTEDGRYRIFGQKIFITFGEHDMSDNIIHLVLARLSDAPFGTRGLSLFLVPKFLVNADGSLGDKNDVICTSIEEKLGIHASPTCVMTYGDRDGAIGWLIGEQNRGLQCMFTMMNNARLAVGVEGVGVSDRAFQHAAHYANERRQGREQKNDKEMSPILFHPDVKRMLAMMKSQVEAARALCLFVGFALDMARSNTADTRKWRERADILTPIAKAHATNISIDITSTGIQVHGGMGFIEEMGAAQYLRDVRITPIYEGTNGIQAIDLVLRKIPLSDGQAIRDLIDDLREALIPASHINTSIFSFINRRAQDAIDALHTTTEWLLATLDQGQIDKALSVATPYLRLCGLVCGAAWLTKGAAAATHLAEGIALKRIAIAHFYCEHFAPEAVALASIIQNSAETVLNLPEDIFAV